MVRKGPARTTYARCVRVLFSRRWLLLHLGLVAAVVGCVALCWWQITRASEGNPRSFGYAFEWPTFAVILVVLWIRGMREAVRGPGVVVSELDEVPDEEPNRSLIDGGFTREEIIAVDEAEDPELAAYNRKLAALHAADERRHG